MNTQYLRYLVEIEKAGSISQAAANLYLSQPNLSKAIREMEQSLQVRILDRSHRGVRFTEKGRQVLAAAKRILAEEDALMDLAHPQEDKAACRLAVLSDTYLYLAFTRFIAGADPADIARVSYQEMDSAGVARALSQGEATMGLVRFDSAAQPEARRILEEAGLMIKEQWTFSPRLTFSLRSGLAGLEEARLADLDGFRLVRNNDLLCEAAAEHELSGYVRRAPRALTLEGQEHKLDFLSLDDSAYIWSSPIPEQTLASRGLRQRACVDLAFCCTDAMICPAGYSWGRLEMTFGRHVADLRRELGF